MILNWWQMLLNYYINVLFLFVKSLLMTEVAFKYFLLLQKEAFEAMQKYIFTAS